MSSEILSPPYVLRTPEFAGPVLFEIPRSGRQYPGDFRTIASLEELQKSVSMFVEECYTDVVDAQAAWLFAQFPNTYIDLNRHELDLNPDQLSSQWPAPLEPSSMSERGIGLIPTLCARTKPIYDAPLAVEDVQRRLDHYYWPYHLEIKRILANSVAQFGAALHMSCHSMPHIVAVGPDAGSARSEFDLGDRNGTTCSPLVTETVAEFLRDRGYSVTVNKYFVGAEAVRKHGNPGAGVHSLQIEMNRGLFMNEERRLPIDRMVTVRSDMKALAERLAALSAELAR